MASSLKLTFNASGDKKVSVTFPYADDSAAPAQVKNLMQQMVANNTIYAEAPLALAGVEFINRTSTSVDLS